MTDDTDQQTKRRWIRPLPKQLINKIAAGEVVERPASVIKELVENSLDAAATQIDVLVEKSGTKLIKIIDNGCGIPGDQLEIAFARHATSKISGFEDLKALTSYGFRGEALPSIASVSRMRMVSRTPDSTTGNEIIIEGGVLKNCQPIGAQPGTMIEVEHIFFNTPARRKFLKSESAENRQISRTVTALALARPDVAFSFTSNGRKVFYVAVQSLKQRTEALLSTAGNFIEVNGGQGSVVVKGFVGRPETVRNNRYGQYLFINDRFIHSPGLAHALAAGFGELLPRGSYPVGVLLLSIDPAEVDVNVHPAKTEVRLSNEREVYDAIKTAVRKSLRIVGIVPAFRPQAVGHGHQARSMSFSGNGPVIPGIGATPVEPRLLDELNRMRPGSDDNCIAAKALVDRTTGEIKEKELATETPVPAAEIPSVSTVATDFPERVSSLIYLGQFSELYLLFHNGREIMVIDQHTAHERVLYEEILDQLNGQSAHAQNLLFPVQVELAPPQMTLFESEQAMFNQSGFVAKTFGSTTVNIEAIPACMSGKAPERLFLQVLDDILTLRRTGHDATKAMAQSIACRAAVMAGDRMSAAEAENLVQRLLKCDERFCCPHGRPTMVSISRADLDKQFGRG